jgi:DNA-binding NarL/FixJ family response regulator
MLIKLVIADDHKLLINGLLNTLKPFKHIDITGTFENGKDLLAALDHLRPDVLLLDIHLPDNNGGNLARTIAKKYPDIRILILTSLESNDHVKAMIQYGCSGYLFKSRADEAKLVEAIEQVYQGHLYIEPSLQKEYLQSHLKIKKRNDQSPKLTRREQEILKLIIEENTNQEIADTLSLSHRTVEGHRLSIMQKLDAKNTVGLIKAALERGIIL